MFPPKYRSSLLLTLALVVCEVLLYGRSLVGRQILAPTDILVTTGILGEVDSVRRHGPENALLLDPVEIIYPGMEFAARELRAGRLPLWNPYTYCGSPFLASDPSAVFQPVALPFYLWPDPRMFVWIHLIKTIVAGWGGWLLLRRLGISEWSSLVGGILFAHAGYFVAWLSFPLSACAVWLPWGFLAVETMVGNPRGWGGPGLAAVIAAMLLSGHLETAAQLLLAIGLYGVWRWSNAVWSLGWRPGTRSGSAAVAAVVIGFGIGSVQLLPTAEYLQSSLRLQQRREGKIVEDAATDRAAELLRLLFPYALGTWQRDSRPIAATTFNESSVNGYVGFTLLAVLAPIGVAHGWRRGETWFWVALGLLAAAPLFRLPLLELWTRLPPFDLMRGNRMLVITGWSAIVLGVRGLDAMFDRRPSTVWVGSLCGGVAVIGAIAFAYIVMSEPAKLVSLTTRRAWPWFRDYYESSAWICAAAAACTVIWLARESLKHVAFALIAMLAVGELLIAEHGYNPQVDPSTYYPRRGWIEYVQQHVGSNRICGLRGMVTPNIPAVYGLRDIRGYDSVDPLPYLELLSVANEQWQPRPSYAITRSFWSGPSPVLDMLAVKYVISKNRLDTAWPPEYEGDGLWVYRNQSALPRAFVPARAVVVPDLKKRLEIVGGNGFDPRELAVITEPCDLPEMPSRGSVELLSDLPGAVDLQVHAETDAIVVLADSWSPGWTVRVDGKLDRTLQANHALRAVRVPKGDHRVEWRYRPASVRLGLWLSAVGIVAAAAWSVMCLILCRRRTQ